MSYIERIARNYQNFSLTEDELSFYSRHLLLPNISVEGQQKLKAARVLVIGAGGLGCSILQGLAGAGVGFLTLVDGDKVSRSNLARQWLHTINDLGKNKALSARGSAVLINPYIQIEAHTKMLDADNSEQLIASNDIVIDATDEMSARHLIDRVSAKYDRPWIHGALFRNWGQVCTMWDKYGASFQKLYHKTSNPPSCSGAGVLGISASQIANLQVLKTIQLITGLEAPEIGTVTSVDTFKAKYQKFKIPKVTQPELILTNIKSSDFICSINELCQRISVEEPIRLIDIRSETLHLKNRIKNSEWMSIHELLKQDFRNDKLVVLYCEQGCISELVARALRSNNQNNVQHLEDGYRNWINHSKSIEFK